jgi:hypothetical protein
MCSALLRIPIVRHSVSSFLVHLRVGRHGNTTIAYRYGRKLSAVLCWQTVSPAPWSQWWPQNPSQHTHVARHLTWLFIALYPTLPAPILHSNGHAAAQWAMHLTSVQLVACQLFTACTAIITSATA